MFPTLLCILVACSSLGPDQASPPPGVPEWSSTSIGYEPSERSDPTNTAGVVKLTGEGAGIWGETDEFYYFYTPLPADGMLTVRVWEFAHAQEWSKAGVMLRSSLEPESTNVMVSVTGAKGVQLQSRSEEGAVTTSGGQVEGAGADTWLRLGRWGNEIVGEYSINGFEWQQLGRYTVDATEESYIGLAVTSHDPDKAATAEFTDLELRRGDIGTVPDAAGPPAGNDSPTGDAWVCGDQPLSPGFAPTLFVSTDGDDSSDGRLESSPFRSLQRAADLARAGDVVWVRGGVYSANVVLGADGTEAQPIVFESYPGECAIIDGLGLEAEQLVQFNRASFYVFRNFEVRNSQGQGIHVRDSSNIVVSNVRSHHNGLSGIQNVGGRENRFTHFLVHDNSDGREGDADGIGISSGSGMRIDHCAAFRNSDDGIDLWKSHGSVVEYCVAFENGFLGGDGNGFKAGGGLRNGDAVLRFNISFGNESEGFTHNSGGGVRFENNTAFDNGIYGFTAANNTLFNNISFDNGRGDLLDDGGNKQEANSWNLRLANPDFASTNPNSADFLALAEGSGAIGNAAGSTGSHDLGALPNGETIESFLGIDLGELLSH